MSKIDGLFKLEYMAYCMSQMPPEEVKPAMVDYVRFAKFHLSLDKHLLMEDPVWDKYTDEQILIEYMAGLFMKSADKLKEFEAKIAGQESDLHDWFDKKIAENRKEMAEQLGGMEDHVSFSPESLGEY